MVADVCEMFRHPHLQATAGFTYINFVTLCAADGVHNIVAMATEGTFDGKTTFGAGKNGGGGGVGTDLTSRFGAGKSPWGRQG